MEYIVNNNTKVLVDDCGKFIYSGVMNEQDLHDMINFHLTDFNMRSRFEKLQRYYVGKHDYLDFKLYPQKKPGKPDDRILVNFPEELVNNNVGFFAGTPAKISYQKDNGIQSQVLEFLTLNDTEDKLSELAKQVDIYGRSHLLLYQNEDKETRLAIIPPTQAFVVYDDSVEVKPIYGVRYRSIRNDGYSKIDGTLYTNTYEQDFCTDGLGGGVRFNERREYAYNFGGVPLVEFYANNERIGLFENVMSLVDGVDKAISNKSNDINYFANEILKVINAKIDEPTLDDAISKRIFNVPQVDSTRPVDIGFLQKSNADTVQEHFIERAVDFIYTKSGIANYNDEVFSNASGTALEFKLQAMTYNAKTKARKFTAALREIFRMAFNVGGTLPQLENGQKDIDILFTTTVPHNISDEANTAKTLLGVTDEKTALSVLSIVTDPASVIKNRDAEQADKAKQLTNLVNNPSDFETRREDNDPNYGE